MANSPSSRSMGTVAMRWHGDRLELLDQRLLPGEEHWITSEGASGVAQCITDMVVRGGPALVSMAATELAWRDGLAGLTIGRARMSRGWVDWAGSDRPP